MNCRAREILDATDVSKDFVRDRNYIIEESSSNFCIYNSEYSEEQFTTFIRGKGQLSVIKNVNSVEKIEFRQQHDFKHHRAVKRNTEV